jgi:hypothetical protein
MPHSAGVRARAAAADNERRRHLSVVPDINDVSVPHRTIGRVIAQTALMADGAMHRRDPRREQNSERHRSRRFGWFL